MIARAMAKKIPWKGRGIVELFSINMEQRKPCGSAALQCGKACLSEKSWRYFRGYASTAGIACQKRSGGAGKASLTALVGGQPQTQASDHGSTSTELWAKPVATFYRAHRMALRAKTKKIARASSPRGVNRSWLWTRGVALGYEIKQLRRAQKAASSRRTPKKKAASIWSGLGNSRIGGRIREFSNIEKRVGDSS